MPYQEEVHHIPQELKRLQMEYEKLHTSYEKMVNLYADELDTTDVLRETVQQLQGNQDDIDEREISRRRLLNYQEMNYTAEMEKQKAIEELEEKTKECSRLLAVVQSMEEDAAMDRKKQDTRQLDLEEDYQELKVKCDLLEDRLEQVVVAKDVVTKELNASTSAFEKKIQNLHGMLKMQDQVRSRLHNEIVELKGNIRVFCRVRPRLKEEDSRCNVFQFPDKREACRCIDLSADKTAHVSYGTNSRNEATKKWSFTFDRVFTPSTTQEYLFDQVAELIQSALDGHNICIFAYGQTGSGKTYTMLGSLDSLENTVAAKTMGIVSRATTHIFQVAEERAAFGWIYTVQVEMIEIYNGTIVDMLDNESPKLDIRTDADGVPYTNATKKTVQNVTHAMQYIESCLQKRITKKTNSNDASSRSHCIVTLHITGENPKTQESRYGKVNLVDLAGSERLTSSGNAHSPVILQEARAINKSLSSLSNVIFSISKKETHIPYRDSKLTHILQPSLQGESKTLMICNLSPLSAHRQESLNTMRFAQHVNSCEIALSSLYKST